MEDNFNTGIKERYSAVRSDYAGSLVIIQWTTHVYIFLNPQLYQQKLKQQIIFVIQTKKVFTRTRTKINAHSNRNTIHTI